jgi:hypothetical protein
MFSSSSLDEDAKNVACTAFIIRPVESNTILMLTLLLHPWITLLQAMRRFVLR